MVIKVLMIFLSLQTHFMFAQNICKVQIENYKPFIENFLAEDPFWDSVTLKRKEEDSYMFLEKNIFSKNVRQRVSFLQALAKGKINKDSLLVDWQVSSFVIDDLTGLSGGYYEEYFSYQYTGIRLLPENKSKFIRLTKKWKKIIQSKKYTQNHPNTIEVSNQWHDFEIIFLYLNHDLYQRISFLNCVVQSLKLDIRTVKLLKLDLDTLLDTQTPIFYENQVLNQENLNEAVNIWKKSKRLSF